MVLLLWSCDWKDRSAKKYVLLLADPAVAVREKATAELREQGTDVTSFLANTLSKEKDYRLRHPAVIALWHMGPRAFPAMEALIEALNDGFLYRNVAECIVAIGAPAVPQLVKLLKHPSSHMRGEAAKCLGRIASMPEIAVPPLLDAITDEDRSVSMRSCEALLSMRIDSNLILERLAQNLETENQNVRLASIYVIGELSLLGIEVDSLMANLIKGLEDDSSFVRAETLEVLDKAGCPKPVLISHAARLLNDKEDNVRDVAGELLVNYASPEVPSEDLKRIVNNVLILLKDENPHFRRIAAKVLGNIGSGANPALAELVRTLGDSDESVRDGAREALKAIRGSNNGSH